MAIGSEMSGLPVSTYVVEDLWRGPQRTPVTNSVQDGKVFR